MYESRELKYVSVPIVYEIFFLLLNKLWLSILLKQGQISSLNGDLEKFAKEKSPFAYIESLYCILKQFLKFLKKSTSFAKLLCIRIFAFMLEVLFSKGFF